MMKLRYIDGVVLPGILAAAFAAPALGAGPERPNIIFFYPDQLRAHEVGCYGNAVARTPNLDRLAAQGVRFQHAMPGLPVCTPARACVLTGRMPFSVRCVTPGQDWMVVNAIEMHTNEITIAEELNKIGYSCGHVGSKWHVQQAGGLNCITNRQGYTFFEGLNSYGQYIVPRYCNNNGQLITVNGRWNPDVMTDRAINFIAANRDGPFYLNVWLCPPHAVGSYSWGVYHPPSEVFSADRMGLWNQFASVTIPLRPNVPGSLADFAQHQLRVYDAMTTGIDECLGRILDTLATLGIADNTIIIVSADHGGQMGSHAVATDTTDGWEKNTLYEESILVPLIVYDPRNAPPAQVRSELIPQMDLMPTMLELAGAPTPQRAQGRSFAPLITGQGAYQPRDAVMVQFNTMSFEHTGFGRSRALRTDRWKYGVVEVGAGTRNLQAKALFDLQVDPYEMNNLVNQPAYAAVQTQLHRRLLQEMQNLEDPLAVDPRPEIMLDKTTIEHRLPRGLSLAEDAFTVTNRVGTGVLDYTVTACEPWISVAPANGTSTGESDPIRLTYQTASLGFGTHVCAVTVADPAASNSPQTLLVTLSVRIPGDMDDDQDVDQTDFGAFQICVSGAGVPRPPGCEDADIDLNGAVDAADAGLFLNCMGGPNQPPGC